MKEKIKAALIKILVFLGTFLTISFIFICFILFLGGAVLFGDELNKNFHERKKRERIQFLRDSLQVEVLKKQINEQKN